jgi:flagellar biogenesis protein FliO
MNSLSQAETMPAVSSELNSGKAPSQPAGLQVFARQLVAGITWILQKIKVQPVRKTLRLCENLSLGEKRFVAVIQVESERFLIGGAAGSVSLLTRLQETPNFSESLQTKLKEEAAR